MIFLPAIIRRTVRSLLPRSFANIRRRDQLGLPRISSFSGLFQARSGLLSVLAAGSSLGRCPSERSLQDLFWSRKAKSQGMLFIPYCSRRYFPSAPLGLTSRTRQGDQSRWRSCRMCPRQPRCDTHTPDREDQAPQVQRASARERSRSGRSTHIPHRHQHGVKRGALT